MIVTEARNLAIKEILPTQKEGDESAAVSKTAGDRPPRKATSSLEAFQGRRVGGHAQDPEYGGQGMPQRGRHGGRRIISWAPTFPS
jgi:hypothetical protein